MDGQQQLGDPIEKLYNIVKGKGYYTKSLNEFKTKYSTPQEIDKIYNVVSSDGLYTKSKDDFYSQYFAPVEKKSKVGGISPTQLNGDGPALSGGIDADAVRSFVTGKPVEEIKATKQANMKPPAKITTPVLTQVKSQNPSEESITEEADKKINQISDEDLADPIKGINKLSQANPTNAKDILATQKAKDILMSRMASDGFDAKDLLNRSFFGGAGDDNITSRELRNKAADYDKSVAPLREIEVDADLSQANDLFLDYNYKDKIYSAAVQAYAEKHPSFKKELGVTGIDAKDWANIRNKIPNGKMGVIMSDYLSDPNVSSFLQKENPSLIPAFKHVEKTLLKDNNDFAINEVANKVSKAVQETGYNNIDPVFNFYDEGHKEYADQIARQTLSPEELAVWDKDIKNNQEQYMDAPSLMQGVAEGGEGIFKGIGNTFTEPFRSASESTKRRWEKESSNVSADPQGIFKVMRDTGHVIGLVGAIAGTGNVLGGGGAGIYSSKIVPALSGGVLPFLGDSLEEGRAKYPDSPVKAWTSALFNTSMYAALSQSLFPVKKVQQALGSVKPDINNIVERLANGSITKEAARIEANTAFKKALDFVGGTLKTPTKITAELTAIQKLNKGLDYIMMDDDKFKESHPEKDETKDVLHLWLSNLALGGFSKFGEMKNRNRVAEESYYELASNPKKYERIIDNLSVDKSFGTINEFKENLAHIANVKKELDGLHIAPKDQKRFIFESLKEKAAKEETERTTDTTVQQKSKDIIKDAKEIKEKILAGEDAESVVTESQKKEIDEANKKQETVNKIIQDLDNLKKNRELDNKEFDEKRAALDGRTPEDRIKIEKLDQQRKEKNEDYDNKEKSLAGKVEGDDALIVSLKSKANDIERMQDLQYFVDKAGENPSRYYEKYGDDITNKLLERVPTETLKKNLDDLLNINPENPNVEVLDKLISQREPSPSMETQAQPEGAAEGVAPSTLKEKSDADIEKRMLDIEDGKGGDMAEFNILEKEMEKRERATVFNTSLDKVNDAVDALIKKDKEQPNGYGSFLDKRDARETKGVAQKYLNPKEITDTDLKKDFRDAVLGNPYTWYADGLKLRESMKEAANRGIDVKDMIAEIEKEYIKDGYTSEDAKATVARKLAPIYEGSQKVNEKQIEQPTNEKAKTTQVPNETEATSAATGTPIEAGKEAEGGGGQPPAEPPRTTAGSGQGGDGRSELDKLANNVPDSGKVAEYMSKETIEKYTGETPSNDQRRGIQELQIALDHGEKIIEKAQTVFGSDYVDKTLEYIEQSTASISNKALMYVSLENALGREKVLVPERAADITKQQALVYEQSQKFAREYSLALNYQKLRKIAQVGYDIERVTNNFFSPDELAGRRSIEEAVEADADAINRESERQELGGMTPDVQNMIKEGVAKEIEKIYEKLPKERKTMADKAIAALEAAQKKIMSKTYDAGLGIPVGIVYTGITTVKLAIKAGVKIADAIELGIAKIKEKHGKEWPKEDEFRNDLTEAFKNVKSVTDFVKGSLIEKGFGREMTVKGEKKIILDWKKLAGAAGTVSKISENVAEVMKDKKIPLAEVESMKEELIKEYVDLRTSVIEKAQSELARRNKENVTPAQKSAAKRLAELYTYGLFESKENEFDIALNKALGAKVSEKGYSEAKEIAQALETIYSSTFKGAKLNDVSAKAAIEKLEDRLRVLLFREARTQGNKNLRFATIVRNYFEIQQTMILNNLKQAVENPFSGLQQNVIDKITDSSSSTPEMATQRRNLMRDVYKDMTLHGGIGYGKIEATFVNRQRIDDYINKLSDNQLYHGIMSAVTGKATLNAMDAMWKAGITEKKFAGNLIKVLTHETNPNKMGKEEALKFVSEQLTGQTFKDAQKTAVEIIEKINKDAGKILVETNRNSVDRFANDIVKAALEMGGKISKESIEAAYNAAYKAAGLGLGHQANNPLSAMITGYSAKIEGDINQAIRNKEWNRAAMLTYKSILFRNILNPFVGGGTNWLVLKLEKTGLGLFTGLAYQFGSKAKIDMSTEIGRRKMEERLYNQARVKDNYMRGLVGGVASLLTYAAFTGIAGTDDYRKWRAKNQWAARYLDIFTPEMLLTRMAVENDQVKKYVSQSFNKNDAFDASTKAIKGLEYLSKGKTNEAWGAFGEMVGSKANLPLPWRLVKDAQVIYQGTAGQDPYHGNYTPSTGFFNGVFQGGAIEYLGWRPEGAGAVTGNRSERQRSQRTERTRERQSRE